MRTWIVQYVYNSVDNTPRVGLKRITADSEAQARQLAVEFAPSQEFVMTLHPESDEQVLGSVKRSALWLSGKGTRRVEEDGEP